MFVPLVVHEEDETDGEGADGSGSYQTRGASNQCAASRYTRLLPLSVR